MKVGVATHFSLPCEHSSLFPREDTELHQNRLSLSLLLQKILEKAPSVRERRTANNTRGALVKIWISLAVLDYENSTAYLYIPA